MDPPPKPSGPNSLFEVYLRLRPPFASTAAPNALYPTLPTAERFLTVEAAENDAPEILPTHITIHPPSDSRKRAVEKFAFTKVFEEPTPQLDLFNGVGATSLVEGVLKDGRDGLVATLGVTGSGKSHTILGSKTQRGVTQLSMELLFRTIDSQTIRASQSPSLIASLISVDASEAQIVSAAGYLDSVFGDGISSSRAATPMTDSNWTPSTPRRNLPQRPTALPRLPDISGIVVSSSKNMEYSVLVSMYEVYNDRIFDLLTHPRNAKDIRRRPLLFKSTERSPDRKIVAGLRKVVCGSYEEALMVLETGLMERRVAGTGSNSVSSRSHGFFCLEVKRRPRGGMAGAWSSSQLTIVDLAGSERARNAKTAGATLAEAGKINESLMYLGQCLQMQSDAGDSNKPSIVPFRQCKLTELLFSNSFPSNNVHSAHTRNPQKGVMIVTADPVGDFNATSQILRYSALAREVTVPRIPSVASIVFQNGIPTCSSSTKGSGRNSPDAQHLVELEGEISRLGDQLEILTVRLAEERARRKEAEQGWKRAEELAQSLEAEVREECFNEMESRIEIERRRWMNALGEEADRTGAHIDRKLELLSRGIQIYEDPATASAPEILSPLESENASLRAQVHKLSRELQTRSPTKPPGSVQRQQINSTRSPVPERGIASATKKQSATKQQSATKPTRRSHSPTKSLLINDGPPRLSMYFPDAMPDSAAGVSSTSAGLEDPFVSSEPESNYPDVVEVIQIAADDDDEQEEEAEEETGVEGEAEADDDKENTPPAMPFSSPSIDLSGLPTQKFQAMSLLSEHDNYNNDDDLRIISNQSIITSQEEECGGEVTQTKSNNNTPKSQSASKPKQSKAKPKPKQKAKAKRTVTPGRKMRVLTPRRPPLASGFLSDEDEGDGNEFGFGGMMAGGEFGDEDRGLSIGGMMMGTP